MRRKGFNSVVAVALAALFGTSALPAYATSSVDPIVNARAALAVQTLTGGATAQIVSREDLALTETAGDLTSTMKDTVSPTVQALAAQLMAAAHSGRLVGYKPNHLPQIANLAEGKAVPGCGIDYRVLQTIAVALQHFDHVGVSDINRRCTGQLEGAGTQSSHYAEGGGHALDFYLLDKSPVTGGDVKSLQLIRVLEPLVPPGTGLGQIECRAPLPLDNFKPFSDSCDHIHIDFLRADGSALRQR